MTNYMNLLYALTHSIVVFGAIMIGLIELGSPDAMPAFRIIGILAGFCAIIHIILTIQGYKLCQVRQ